MKPTQYLSSVQAEVISIMAELFHHVQFKNNNVNRSRVWTECLKNTNISQLLITAVQPPYSLCTNCKSVIGFLYFALITSQTPDFDFFPNNKYVYILYSSVYLGYVWIKFPLSIYNNTDLSLVWNAWEFLIQMWDHRSNNFHIYWCSKSTDKSTHLHICLNHQNNCFMFCFQTKPQDAVRTMLERCPNP